MPKPALRRKEIQAALIIGISTVAAALVTKQNCSSPSHLPSSPSAVESSPSSQLPSIASEGINPPASAEPKVKQNKELPYSPKPDASRQVSSSTETNLLDEELLEPSTRQSPVGAKAEMHVVESGNPLRLQHLGLSLAVQFSQVMGVDYATLVASTGEGIVRKPVMNPGVEIILPGQYGMLRLSVLEVHWSEQALVVDLTESHKKVAP